MTVVICAVAVVGLFAAIAGHLPRLILVVFPLWARLAVIPMVRRRQRTSAEALLNQHPQTLAPRLP